MSSSTGSGRSRRKFTPEFKAEVVAMVEASGGKIAQVAREMRLHESSVGNWVREAKAGNAPTTAERAEIRELRAELERVTRERDILEKQSPTSRRRTRRTCESGVHVHRRGAG